MWNQLSTINRLVRSLIHDRLRTDGREIDEFRGDPVFYLSEDYPSIATIKVFRNGTLMTSGYSYNAQINAVVISTLLSNGDKIMRLYSYYDKYSDSEITDYIESSFTYFAQFGYRKLFKLSDDRTEVLTIDGLNPTAKECYQIAIISAICVDPQNIEIRTKDFTVTAMEKESKSDLIAKALTQFTTWYGEFSFEEDYREDVP